MKNIEVGFQEVITPLADDAEIILSPEEIWDQTRAYQIIYAPNMRLDNPALIRAAALYAQNEARRLAN